MRKTLLVADHDAAVELLPDRQVVVITLGAGIGTPFAQWKNTKVTSAWATFVADRDCLDVAQPWIAP